MQLEQLERLRSEDTPRRPMITHHTIDQFICSSQNKMKAEKFEKFVKNWNFRNLLLT